MNRRVLQRAMHSSREALGDGLLQHATANSSYITRVPSIVHSVLRSPGQPLDPVSRTFMERRFGHDFSQVRVHTDDKAAESARAANALAYTAGSNIVFGTGQYAPDTATGQRLLAHELSHVAQQRRLPGVIQRKPATPKQDVLERLDFFLMNPDFQEGASKIALKELDATYRPHVKLEDVEFRRMTRKKQRGPMGLTTDAQSYWEGKLPVVELGKSVLGDFVKFESDPVANLHSGHNVIRIVGHEMYHLYREKIKHVKNPLQPLFEKEYQRRMRQVRQNWVAYLREAGYKPEKWVRDLLAKRPRITRWKDIPVKEQEKIETEAAETDMFQGMYHRTAYLVEEIYAKIEELSFLRIEQRLESGTKEETRAEASELAHLVYKIWNFFTELSTWKLEFLTPDLLEKTRANMETYIRNRYGKGKREPYELRFFRTATKHGTPPL